MVPSVNDRRLPAIDPALKPCSLCDDLPCIAACPDGALVDPGGPDRVRIGIAKVDPRRCVTFRGQRCDRCYQICPYPDRAIMMIGSRPLVGSGACTGCGLCEYACPEEPKAIEVIAERLLVPGLRVPRTEYEAG
jgi:ferredoxin-type protein NapG